VAITPDGTRAYVTNPDSNSVSVIDTATNSVVATIAVGGFGVAITPDGTRAYVAGGGFNTVAVIDTTTNSVVATIPVGQNPPPGGNPFGVAITPDGARAYVTNQDSGALRPVDG